MTMINITTMINMMFNDDRLCGQFQLISRLEVSVWWYFL